MLPTQSIRYLGRDELDTNKWDRSIEQADNGLIYAFSWYLDAMAGHWSALVMGDYEYVMPLTWKRKYGVAYIYQPFLTAQLGVFGKNLQGPIVENFLQQIPSRYRYWDFYLNHQNLFHLGFPLYERNNFILQLDQPYEKLFAGYRENIRRNIKRATQLGCRPVKNVAVEEVITLATQQMMLHDRGEANDNIERFRKLYVILEEKKMSAAYGIVSGADQLLASCVFFFSHHRAYYILVGNHPDGRTIGASHLLIDAFIKDHAGKQLTLDFEGSDIRNLAFFYSSFGAQMEKYAAIHRNSLPFYLKWFKK